MNFSRLLATLGFIMIGVSSRLLPHPPNFTSLNAIALFGAIYFQSRWISLAMVFSTLLISDLFIGFHSTMPFVYLSFGLIISLGYHFKNSKFLTTAPLTSLYASLLFFFVSNFGVWLTGSLYPKTINGLGLCYLAAIPFLTNQIAGDLVYLSILFGYVYLVEKLAIKQKPIY